MIIGLVRNTAGFEHLHDEGNLRRLKCEIARLFEDRVWRITDEIREQLGTRKKTVTAALRDNPHLFRSEPGERHGRSVNATLWQFAVDTDAAEVVELFPPQPERELQ